MHGAQHLARGRELLRLGQTGDAEVRDDRAPGGALEQDVLRLHIAVHDAARVRVAERERDVAKLGDGLGEGRAPVGLDALRERVAVDVAHDEEHLPGDLVRAMDRHDARVRQVCSGARFAEEALADVAAAGEVRGERLDRYRAGRA